MTLPATERLLLGPGPSPIAPRVMRAMAAPVLSHLDGELMAMLEEVSARLGRVFRAGDGALSLAISGTGTSAMEASVANLVGEGTRVLVVVTGYFGDRLAEICRRYGARVTRLDVEWGRAVDPEAVRRALADNGADIVGAVHAETSTGVLNPIAEIAAVARAAGAMTIVDAVTSLAAHPVETGQWQLDACYSCSQKGVGAPSGMGPLSFSARAKERRIASRSFYLDLGLLEDYWMKRKYHHTLSATMIYALREALTMVEEEGLEARWNRHRLHHEAFAAGIRALGLELLPPAGERLWTLNAVRVPEGVDEASIRRQLLQQFNIEIGAGLGPLAGRIFRVGLMGAGSTPQVVLLLLAALERTLRDHGHRVAAGASSAAVDRLSSPA
jgi:alanine-glyoxylate transaminase/serine-glyoxylate transaminase/serine-pyruvate transaminase